MTRTAADVRREFIEFFRDKHAHAIVPSSPVVPHDDPTLLFTNAGMNQFKPYFLGTEKPKHTRVANTQKCIRAGGKHNDLDDVGHDTYHHTFFEMLGNWSFGDYFKKEAIEWAWELLTKVWGLDKARLHATYFGGDETEGLEPDLEAKDLWASVTDINPEHIHPGDKKDNFWEMGETGPCGPCSEIHMDLTPDKSGRGLVNAGDARVIEIWNLVFIQFSRGPDGKLTPLPAKHVDTGLGFERVTAVLQGHNNNYATDVFVPIIQAIEDIAGHIYGGSAGVPPVDVASGPRTGRDVAAGGSPAVVDRYATIRAGNMQDEACRVIADHIRCLTFALTDGAVPDREGRGYVLRRILRRGIRFGWQYLDLHKPFLCDLVDTVVDVMGEAFPELKQNPQHVKEIIREEEESFERTLDRGIKIFEFAAFDAVRHAEIHHELADEIEIYDRNSNVAEVRQVLTPEKPLVVKNPRRLKVCIQDANQALFLKYFRRVPVIPGNVAFILHDTYGFPIDLTQIMAEEKGLQVDIVEYERLMDEARERARSSRGRRDAALFSHPKLQGFLRIHGQTKFIGYYTFSANDGIDCILTGPELAVDSLKIMEGETGAIIISKTPFYAESGGQVGDTGDIVAKSGLFRVEDTQELDGVWVHIGKCVSGFLAKYDPDYAAECSRQGLKEEAEAHTDFVVAKVDRSERNPTMQNHTATHVMNWALREVLGENVQQKGSLVDPEKTRFDFSHPRALTPEELARIEQLVNEKIVADLPVYYQDVAQEQALKINGLRAVFGEKYPDLVRVMSIGVPVEELVSKPDNPDWRQYSIEFCGGTHLKSTGEIEQFVLVNEEAVAKGIRRVVGVTGDAARAATELGAELLNRAHRLEAGATVTAKAGAARAEARGSSKDVIPGLATQVSELQQTIAGATLRMVDRMKLRDAIAKLQKIVKQQQKADAADAVGVVKQKVDELLQAAEKIGETTVVVGEMPDLPVEQLKTGADMIKQKCGSAAVLFGVRGGEKALLLAAMTPDLIKKGLKAGDLVKSIAKTINGGGGGPPTMAQAGGKAPEKIGAALDAGRKWIGEKL